MLDQDFTDFLKLYLVFLLMLEVLYGTIWQVHLKLKLIKQQKATFEAKLPLPFFNLT